MSESEARSESDYALERLSSVVETVVKGLVDHEDEVKIVVIAEQMHTNLKVQVADGDFGKVVGRGGKTADALRFLVKAVGHKFNLPTCQVYVDDPNPDRRGRPRSRNEGWRGRDR